MFSHLRGILHSKSPTEIVVDVNGVGYALSIPLSTFEKLGEPETPIKILTYLHVREDALQLYGFATEAEREIFRLLISVSGIGPKIAQAILSGVPTDELTTMIAQGEVASLTAIPGVGRKTAERLVVDLRDKIGRIETALPTAGIPGTQQGARSEALKALLSLGFNRPAAEKAIRTALQELNGKEVTVEELLRLAIKSASSQ